MVYHWTKRIASWSAMCWACDGAVHVHIHTSSEYMAMLMPMMLSRIARLSTYMRYIMELSVPP